MVKTATSKPLRDRTEQLEQEIHRLRTVAPTPVLVDSLLTLALELFVNDVEQSLVITREAEELSRTLAYIPGLIHAFWVQTRD